MLMPPHYAMLMPRGVTRVVTMFVITLLFAVDYALFTAISMLRQRYRRRYYAMPRVMRADDARHFRHECRYGESVRIDVTRGANSRRAKIRGKTTDDRFCFHVAAHAEVCRAARRMPFACH